MHEDHRASARETRMEVFNSFREGFASAPIRLMSRTVSAMRAMGYGDLASAIGDLDWRTVPPDDPEDPTLRHDWHSALSAAFEHVGGWLRQLSAHPMGYNLDSIGYPVLTRAWGAMWNRQLGLDFVNQRRGAPQIMLFHGGNQALQAALLGIAEARRERAGRGGNATVLVPIPTFSCPLDQMALQGMNVFFLPPSDSGMDPDPADLERVPTDVEIDGVYMMPVNNPTGRTLQADRQRAFVDGVLDRWPHAGVIMDSVYVRMHPDYQHLLAWYREAPRYADSVLFIDSLSKTNGVTGLRAGAILTKASRVRDGIVRYAQNVMAGPSNAMQAVAFSLLAPFVSGDDELVEHRIRLQLRIGRHLQRRRRLLVAEIFRRFPDLLADEQPVLPDPVTYDWEGSMYADLKLSETCCGLADEHNVSPTVAFYLETGIAGVPLEGFCANRNLARHGLVINGDSPELQSFQEETRRFVRLSFGLTPPPDPS